MLVDSALSVVSAGIDYCTMTAKRGDRAEQLRERANRLLQSQVSSGNELRTWKLSGYRGKRSGGVAFGVRHDGCILVLSSAAASASTVESIPMADNVSRLDLQITCFDSSQQAERAHLAYYSMLEAPRRRGRPPSASLRLNSRGGQTLYCGSRASDRVGRLYDKGIEQKTAPAGAYWRYEVEYKRGQAAQVARLALEKKLDDALVAAFVADYFGSRGLPIPACVEDAATVADAHRAALHFDGVTDADRTLRWLNQTVAASVQRLIDSGRLSDVVRALGLGGQRALALLPDLPTKEEE